jgi:BON domain
LFMNTSSWVRFVALVVLTLSTSTFAFAQGGGTGGTGGGTGTGGTGTIGGGTGTGGTGTGGTGTGGTGTGGTGTGGTTGNQQQNGQTAQPGATRPLDTSLDLGITPVEIPDVRNSGFVGPTSAVVRQNGFVGASSPAMGSVPQENSTGLQGSGAGGTGTTAPRTTGAASGGARTTGAGGLAGNRNLGGGIGGFGQGSQGTFQVTRSSLRFPLTNQINFKAATNDQVVSRFQSRVNRNSALPKSGFNVSVSNGVATVTGEVDSSTAAALIESQLRLEPGIYKIDNQLKYKN